VRLSDEKVVDHRNVNAQLYTGRIYNLSFIEMPRVT